VRLNNPLGKGGLLRVEVMEVSYHKGKRCAKKRWYWKGVGTG